MNCGTKECNACARQQGENNGNENMDKNHKIQLFNGQKVRTAWNADEEKWYFSIGDVVEVLTDSADPKQYIKKMKMRDPELKNNWGTICTLVELVSSDGKKRKEMTADHLLSQSLRLPSASRPPGVVAGRG